MTVNNLITGSLERHRIIISRFRVGPYLFTNLSSKILDPIIKHVLSECANYEKERI